MSSTVVVLLHIYHQSYHVHGGNNIGFLIQSHQLSLSARNGYILADYSSLVLSVVLIRYRVALFSSISPQSKTFPETFPHTFSALSKNILEFQKSYFSDWMRN